MPDDRTAKDVLTERVAVLKVLSRAIAVQLDGDEKTGAIGARDQLAKLMKRGEGQPIVSPIDEAKIGKVSLSDPKPVATITSRATLEAHIREHTPEKVSVVGKVTGDPDEVWAVLKEHAPHLVDVVDTVPSWAFEEVRKKSEAAGQPCALDGTLDLDLGITITKPEPVLSFSHGKESQAAVAALMAQGFLGIDGVVKQLPSPATTTSEESA